MMMMNDGWTVTHTHTPTALTHNELELLFGRFFRVRLTGDLNSYAVEVEELTVLLHEMLV